MTKIMIAQMTDLISKVTCTCTYMNVIDSSLWRVIIGTTQSMLILG